MISLRIALLVIATSILSVSLLAGDDDVREVEDTVNPLHEWLQEPLIRTYDEARDTVEGTREQLDGRFVDAPAEMIEHSQQRHAPEAPAPLPPGQNVSKGILYVFFSVDAPNMVYMSGALGNLKRTHPGVQIALVNLSGIGDFVAVSHRMREWTDRVASQVSAMDERLGELFKNNPAQWRRVTERMTAEMEADSRREFGWAEELAVFYGLPGLPVIDDVTPALAMQVREVPTFYFISPTETVHHLRGVGQSTDLGLWIDRCLSWEESELDDVRQRFGVP